MRCKRSLPAKRGQVHFSDAVADEGRIEAWRPRFGLGHCAEDDQEWCQGQFLGDSLFGMAQKEGEDDQSALMRSRKKGVRPFQLTPASLAQRNETMKTAFVRLSAILFAAFSPLAKAGLNSGPEYDCLTSLYTATNGATWATQTNWNVGDACSWYGITCDQDIAPSNNSSHVINIDLSSNGLTGSLSPLGGLLYLQYFWVDHNSLTGGIPALSNLSSLRDFSARDNKLSGTIPSLSGLVELQGFEVGYNFFLTGQIPDLSGLTNLVEFEVAFNQLTGPIPALSEFSNLQYFDVSLNQLTGSIPALTGLTKLSRFSANQDGLTGSIPALTGLTNLTQFWVLGNHLTGSVPDLTGLTKLEYFYVDYNQLTGSIPSLADLVSLVGFDVAYNQLTGPVPAPPPSLIIAFLCPNPLEISIANEAGWNKATGYSPWWAKPYPNSQCDDLFTNRFDS